MWFLCADNIEALFITYLERHSVFSYFIYSLSYICVLGGSFSGRSRFFYLEAEPSCDLTKQPHMIGLWLFAPARHPILYFSA